MNSITRKTIISHLIEFFFIGVVMGVVEDLLAIRFATNAQITFHTLKIAFIVAFPFAVISELLVDLKIFRRLFRQFKKRLTS